MPKPSHKDFSCILNILDSIKRIQQYSSKFANADDFYADTLSFDASMMNFIVIGEMVDKLSDTLIHETSDKINWLKVKGFRNIIAHNYFGIDAEEVWQIINSSLTDLQKNLESLIK
jgi:uncharacterized protein with HEPN domain